MEKLDNIEKIIKERIGQFEINWVAKPFPHAIIDNFLPSNVMEEIRYKFQEFDVDRLLKSDDGISSFENYEKLIKTKQTSKLILEEKNK